jgi:uncharacterized protein
MTNSDTTQAALSYLEQHHVMTLATYGSQGIWSAAVFYVNTGFHLYFISAAHTRHAQNMKSSPQVSAAIHEDYRDWEAIKGIQLEGSVVELLGESRQHAEEIYFKKYTFIKKAPLKIQAALLKISWYKLTPTTLYFIDNSKGFGHRENVHLDKLLY